MLKNIIKTAWRSLLKNKGFTLLNIVGLSLGITTCLFILFYVIDELSFDKYNTKWERIYRINTDLKFGNTFTSRAIAAPVVAGMMVKDFPEIERAVRILPDVELIKKGEEAVSENNGAYCDADIFDVFSLPMIYGNPKTALKEHTTVVISESLAKKYFNKLNVVGMTLTFVGDSNARFDYKITGVIKDMPANSHFHFNLLLPMADNEISKNKNFAALFPFRTYILLKPGTDYKKLEAKFPALLRANLDFYDAMLKEGSYIKMNLTPLTDIHLHSNKTDELGKNSDSQYVRIFSISAALILFIACFNFMNLSTARSSNRAREVGVRKVLGSSRTSLIGQFLSESTIVTICACLIAILLGWMLLPWFNQTSGKHIKITSQIIGWLLPAAGFFIVFIGVIAGSYPAFLLSAFKPSESLKNNLPLGFRGNILRNSLVIIQFSISIFLIVCTLVIYHQLRFIQNKDLGFQRDHVLIVKNMNSLMGKDAFRMKREVKQLPGVINATLSSFLPVGNRRWENFVNGNNHEIQTQFWPVDEDYLPTMGMGIIKGRNFSNQFPTDSNAVLINQKAAAMFEFPDHDPLNKEILYGKSKVFHIIGITRDFNFNSLRQNVTPTLMMMMNDWAKKEEGDGGDNLCIKIRSENLIKVISSIESYWKSLSTMRSVEYSFMDDDFNAIYESEQRMAKIFVTFTSLAIIIACLGLFGLAAYAAEQRSREISIRKVLGASVSGILLLLSKNFIRLTIFSIFIATPLAYLAMQKWLQAFAFRVNVHWWDFALAGLTALLVAFTTVCFQSLKAANANPVTSLRSE